MSYDAENFIFGTKPSYITIVKRESSSSSNQNETKLSQEYDTARKDGTFVGKFTEEDYKAFDCVAKVSKKTSVVCKKCEEKKQTNALKSVLQNMSIGMAFSHDVIQNRSPHSLPFNQNNKNIFKHKQLLSPINHKSKPFKSSQRTLGNKNVTKGAESPISATASLEKINSLHKKTSQVSYESLYKENGALKHEASHSWDEHVLTLLSKSTTSLILRDFTLPKQHRKLKRFLELYRSGKYEEDLQQSVIKEDSITPSEVSADIKSQSLDHTIIHRHTDSRPTEPRLQKVYPNPPKDLTACKSRAKPNKIQKGTRKWVDYPVKIEKKQHDLIIQNISSHNLSFSIDADSKPLHDYKNELLHVVTDWSNKWLLEKRWNSDAVNELLVDVESINDHMRLAAVASACKVVLDLRQDKDKVDEESRIVEALMQRLHDSCEYVCVAAAITLFAVNCFSEKAKAILMNSVKNGSPTERWVAAQCLAKYCYYDDCIIIELLANVRQDNPHNRKTAERLLQELSQHTMTVLYMIAEMLNSSSWSDRELACLILPTLDGKLTKDISSKLCYLLWNDWKSEVQLAAAQALGKTGHGQLIRDVLCTKLKTGSEIEVIDALRKISKIGVMMSSLLGPLLSCLNSDSDLICLQAIKVVINLKLTSSKVIAGLVLLVTSQRICVIKSNSIKALVKLESRGNATRACLLWSLHYDRTPTVRMEACKAVLKLKLLDDKAMKVLEEIVVADEDENLRKQVREALEDVGVNPSSDSGLTEEIEKNVKGFCYKNNIIDQLLKKEASCLSHVTPQSYIPCVEACHLQNANQRKIPFNDTTLDEPCIPYWSQSAYSISPDDQDSA